MASNWMIAIVAAAIISLSSSQSLALDYLVLVSGDCGDAASKVVKETGGYLLSAEPTNDGRSCIVTVLVQGSGERPRKVTMRVPM
ncbi:hypothetical protein [Rhizobium sp. SSA_523]|uniref:hypothetical protein n=1 Tax=Rhizobium sp. SSA_523 TaxID=2952477 RepID=UPI0020902874|nr:hypothetical protein [Rhizobium sp. SSA_523]MCO5730896.1 hypothetical protein [Rhizobium sp. SSA_523]WKC24289.1 hypothetical protein QTJ18_09465 [Rhizobium sp. SSA_523]